MLRHDYECLGSAANMTTVIELTQFFTCDGVTDINRKGTTFFEIIRERVTEHFVSCKSVYHCFGMSETSLIVACL